MTILRERWSSGVAAWFKSNVWQVAAFLWGVGEATLFFIVPDVLLSAIGLRRGARAGAVASMSAALGAGLGGAAMYMWSAHDAAGARAVVMAVPAVSEAMAAEAARAMAEHGWFVATLAGPLSFTPFKLYAILAPEAGASVAGFAFASVAARLPRFLLVSLGASLLRGRLGARPLMWLCGAWTLFYAAFFAFASN